VLNTIAIEIPEKATKLAAYFWPGSLTLVLKKNVMIPDIITAGKDTVAVRVPNHPLTLALLKSSNTPDYLRLSDDRRKRILLAVFHPAINWIDLHHKLVSIALAVIVLATAILTLRNFEIFREEPLEDGIPIWRYFKTGELPELVEQQLKEASGHGVAEVRGQRAEIRSQRSEEQNE
jgi:hypothetical protein